MRVSYKWLQEYVDIPVSPEELAERLTFSGVAVENIEYLGKDIEKVVTAKVEKIERHPNADKLVVCSVNCGQAENLQIVTGAPNVAEGQIVALALVGAKLPGGIKIGKSKLRGVESAGMVCSAQELGLDPKGFPPDQQEGIIVLPEGTPLGEDIKKVLGLDDVILELELTPNRADCLSMVGVAREVSAVLGTDFRPPRISVPETSEKIDGLVKVVIEAPELCNRYIGRLVRNIKVGPSPEWMQQRLRAAGVRPISNIVDVTNYVMMELGQPLHAFDFDKIQEQIIIVRRAGEGEKIVTLDNQERALNSDMLVIADGCVPVAVAGVMGGLDSEITENTVNVLLESACFNGPSVRRTSRALGLRSEASLRFEKGVDPNGCLRAIDRAAQLIAEMGAGEIVAGVVDNYPCPVKNLQITLRPARLNRVMGTDIPTETMVDILNRLQLPVEAKDEVLLVTVPTFRGDIAREVDLMEEVVRLYGYNRIPTELPLGRSTQGKKTFEQGMQDKVRSILTGFGLNEIITYSFINPKAFDMLNLPAESELRNTVVVQNPISEEQGVMRTTLLHGMLEVVARNLARKNKDLALFEMGNIFIPVAGEKLPREELTLGAVVTGNRPENWNQKAEPMDFFYLKGILETLLEELGVKETSFVPFPGHPALHPGRTAQVLLAGRPVGFIGEVHPEVMENYRLSGRAYVMELALEEIIAVSVKTKMYRSLPKYPGVERDMAVVVKEEVLAADLLAEIRQQGGPLLKNVRLFDVYQGEQIQKGYKSLAYAFLFQSSDRTLTDEEVNDLYEKIQNALQTKFGAQLRA